MYTMPVWLLSLLILIIVAVLNPTEEILSFTLYFMMWSAPVFLIVIPFFIEPIYMKKYVKELEEYRAKQRNKKKLDSKGDYFYEKKYD